MGFPLPDLIIESVLRDGFTELRNNPLILDDLFSDLLEPWLRTKYGEAELNKLKSLFTTRDVSIVHSFHLVSSNVPCISIQLLDDEEDVGKAHLDDYENQVSRPLTDPAALAALVKVSGITVTSYDLRSGVVRVPDSVDLANIHVNLLWKDSAGNTFQIVGGIVNVDGSKQFGIAPGSTPVTTGTSEIRSSIDTESFEQRGNIDRQAILLGIHTKEALTTKYMYQIVKRIIEAHKLDLITRGFQLATYRGSDFTRSTAYPGDTVYDRFLTVTGMIQNSWTSDLVVPFDNIEVQVLVEKDLYTGTQLGQDGLTVRAEDVGEDQDDPDEQ